jgi:hypothetical protein
VLRTLGKGAQGQVVLCQTSASDGTPKHLVVKMLALNEYQGDAHLHQCHVRNVDAELRVMVVLSELNNLEDIRRSKIERAQYIE